MCKLCNYICSSKYPNILRWHFFKIYFQIYLLLKIVLDPFLLSYTFSYRQNFILLKMILVFLIWGCYNNSVSKYCSKYSKWLISHTFLFTDVNKNEKQCNMLVLNFVSIFVTFKYCVYMCVYVGVCACACYYVGQVGSDWSQLFLFWLKK